MSFDFFYYLFLFCHFIKGIFEFKISLFEFYRYIYPFVIKLDLNMYFNIIYENCLT